MGLLTNKRAIMGEYKGFLIRGKFTDDSTPEDWWIRTTNYYGSKTDISSFVDPETKEFVYFSEKKPKSLTYYFYEQYALQKIYEISGTEEVTDARYMFLRCTSLEEAYFGDNFICENCVLFNEFVAGCTALKTIDLSSLDTRCATTFNSFFTNCTLLENIIIGKHFTCENGTNFYSMFSRCASLKYLNLEPLDTRKGLSFLQMFIDCINLTSLKLGPKFTCEQGTNFQQMFVHCNALQSLDISMIDNRNATNLLYVIDSNNLLEEIKFGKLFTCEKAQNLQGAFKGNPKLNNIHVNFDFGSATNILSVFAANKALSNITGKINNIKLSITLQECPLTNESAMVFINGLAEVEEPQTITFSKVTYATLSQEQIKIATDKGWEVKSI